MSKLTSEEENKNKDIKSRYVLFLDVRGRDDYGALKFEEMFGEDGERYASHHFLPTKKTSEEIKENGIYVDVTEKIFDSLELAEEAASKYLQTALCLADHDSMKHSCVYAIVPAMHYVAKCPSDLLELRLNDEKVQKTITKEDLYEYITKETGKSIEKINTEIELQKNSKKRKQKE